nr:transglutaminase domain-containing protein [Halomicroarcula sp. GDY20]
MFHLIDVVGSPDLFLVVVAGALAAAVVLARALRPTLAIAVGAVLFLAGLGWYVANLSTDPQFGALIRDTVALLTGRRLLQIANVRLWVISFTPAPVFLTAYFALRRWYVTATLAAGTTLAFFVLTTDAGVVTTLLGVVGAVAAVGFGTLDRIESGTAARPDGDGTTTERTATDADAGVDSGRRAVLEQLAAIVVIPSLLSRTPSVSGTSLSFAEADGPTVEGSLVNADEAVTIQGDISLTPTVRYTVRSEEPRYWRVAAYDRYTGDGWVRTGNTREYEGGRLAGPPGDSRTLRQSFEAETDIGTVPAAWRPVRYNGDPAVEVTSHGGLQPTVGVSSGDSYDVISEVPVTTPRQLRAAGTAYPDRIADSYLQLPESTPDRVGETTATLTANADDPYETALVVQQWLRNNRGYSLDVDRPERDVADRFLHAMNEGYCVYFATTMAVMLRTQGVPARMAVGYTPGERVDENRWVVRGLDSHAWVEVFFPDHGWIEFDPTPSDPRNAAERARLEEARESGEGFVDTDETGNGSGFTETTPTPPPLTEANGTTATPAANNTTETGETPTPLTAGGGGGGATESGGLSLPELPSREEATLGLVALLGTAAGLRRAGVTDRVQRAIWLRYQRREDPETDVERAFQRVLYVMGQEHRQREAGETVRAYLDAIDAPDEVRRVADLRERLRYGGEVSAELADEAVGIADDVVSNR